VGTIWSYSDVLVGGLVILCTGGQFLNGQFCIGWFIMAWLAWGIMRNLWNEIASYKANNFQHNKIIVIVILCSKDSGNVDARPTPFKSPPLNFLRSPQITITLTESALLILFQSGVEKLLAWVAGD